MAEGENELKERDIVWAKVKGNNWWPGLIKHISFRSVQTNNETIIKEKVYSILFFGGGDKVKLTRKKLEPFLEGFEIHSKTKKSSLLKAIAEAKKLYEKNNSNKIIHIDEDDEEKNKKELKNPIIKKTHSPGANSHSSSYKSLLNESEDESQNNHLQKKRGIISREPIVIEDDEEGVPKIGTRDNIKINININLTTNNQNTVNISSFPANNQIVPKEGIFQMKKVKKILI